MIQIITPKSALIDDERIKKCTIKLSSQDSVAIYHLPLLVYYN